ncbi:MAG: hypothetical protein M3083_01785 [Actinomycetota bacterium]|nr:hypothetical protein [Actinomycetota bacterium]MDQ6945433.1 hypothetical protein [Actinomycetota bacterium]
MANGEWYWCLDHEQAETSGSSCPPGRRLGPYQSKEAAEHWKERVDQRNQAWDAEDEWND